MKHSVEGFDIRPIITLMVAFTIGTALVVSLIIYNNPSRSTPILLFLLVAGDLILASKGFARMGIVGLVVVSLTIGVKQFIGDWEKSRLVYNLLELFLMAGTFYLIGLFHDLLETLARNASASKNKLKALDLEDSSVGLFRSSIGKLRLEEEYDRAVRYKRQLALVLISPTPLTGEVWDKGREQAILRSIASVIKDATRVVDLPFLTHDSKIALMLVDTEINGARSVINKIQRLMVDGRVVLSADKVESLERCAVIRYGFCVFLGGKRKQMDLLQAAERSLQRNIDSNPGPIFQNLFIDWETVGEIPPVNDAIQGFGSRSLTDGISGPLQSEKDLR